MEFKQPVPELPVADVERAQQYYRDVLGFQIEWLYPGKEMGAVSHGETILFFRKKTTTFDPVVHWVFAVDVDRSYQQHIEAGAKIVEGIENKPWGIRQFSIADIDGNIFYFHHELEGFVAGEPHSSVQ